MHKKYPHPPERIERKISAAASISMCVLTVLIQIATTLLLTAFLHQYASYAYALLELAEKVLLKVGGKSKLVFRPLPSDDPKMRRPDITKAKELLKWEPKVSLDDGLDEIIAYFRAKLSL